MSNPEKFPNLSRFVPGMPVRIKGTAEHTINHEFMPNGITGLVEKVENGMVYVAYRIPGDGIKPGQKDSSRIFPFKENEIEEITS
ncbi:MAG: hypothetical protein WC794_00945 [Candidatus Doudnabacteria bacterium]|jgi:hypothetical protein